MKLVSVIITTHEGSEFIERALNSVLNQTYKNLEIIIVDDNGEGSKEQIKTHNKIKFYLDQYKIKYIVHNVNKNGAVARNTGFKNSNGDYISFLDDDDAYFPNKIKSQVKAIEILNNEWGMVYCSVLIKNANGEEQVRMAKKSGDILYDLLIHRVVIGTNTMLIKRNVYQTLNGFDETFLRHQDYEFTARIAANYNIKAVEEIGVEYSRGLSRNSPKTREKAKKFRKHYITKMLPLIEDHFINKKTFIIYFNSIEVLSHHLREGKIIRFLKEFEEYNKTWVNDLNWTVLTKVFFEKLTFSIKRNLEMKITSKPKLSNK